ncbi:tyrosine-type recombinase/integrase [Lentzea albida]|nr:site-specific integrase [Lentzea albida]
MGFTKDLWTQPEKPSKAISERAAVRGEMCRCGKPALKVCTIKSGEEIPWCGENGRIRNTRWGTGKRWLAVWLDPEGRERSKAFKTKTPADLHWAAQETDVERGQYLDPKAGKELFSDVAERFLASRSVDPSTAIKYRGVYESHIKPVLGQRSVKAIRPSDISGFQTKLGETRGASTVALARLVVVGVLDIAVADDSIKKNPALNKIVQSVNNQSRSKIRAWGDATVFAVIDAHPEYLRAMPTLGASCGLREGELFGLAEEDVDFEAGVIHVRRQIKKLGADHIFGLPKNDSEREVPMAEGTAQVLREHMRKYPPRPLTLPWEKLTGKPTTHKILFRWKDGGHLKARNYSQYVWKPAIVAAGVIPKPEKGADGKPKYVTTRKEGTHALRHYYASVVLQDGVNVRELAEYLGHHDAGYTLRQYAHLLPDSHDRARKAINARLFRPRAVS